MAVFTEKKAKEIWTMMLLMFIDICEQFAKENWTPAQCGMLSDLFDTVTQPQEDENGEEKEKN